jgi:Domain of unknown function (DUF6265)
MNLLSVLVVVAMLALAQSNDTAVSRAGFIAGCWERQAGGEVGRETWRVATPDLLIGTSTTVVAGAIREFEFLRVESKGGVVAYLAQPGGAPATRFTLEPTSKPNEVMFVNMQHDFPKRVVYRKTTADALLALIDGGPGTRAVEFPMTRCQ